MKELHADLETRSDVDLAKCGVYKYCASDKFRILLLAYSVDGAPVEVVDMANGEAIPQYILDAFSDKSVMKIAHNASFERTALSRFLGKQISLEGWYCTMIQAAESGLPMSLKAVGAALELTEQKMSEGKDLIKFFCVPKKDGSFHSPQDYPHEWAVFKSYNKRDVEVEVAIYDALQNLPLTPYELANYVTDQTINDYGIQIDRQLVESAIALNERFREQAIARAKEITGLENPNSPMQILSWLKTEKGIESPFLDKEAVAELMQTTTDPEVLELLGIRQGLSKSSIKKYEAMQKVIMADERARGLIQFYGATKTGRYSSKLIQVQNLRRNSLDDLETARELVRSGDYDALEILYDSIPDILSQLVRTAFIPSPGNRFIIGDYGQIEARVLAWIAGEDWKLDAFRKGEDIYCVTASRMFHKTVVKHGENGELRQKGKQTELSCGYSGSVGALKAMGALKLGMKEEELKPLVYQWRAANPKIVQLWYDVNEAVMDAVMYKKPTETNGIRFFCAQDRLFIRLPSGRKIAYFQPQMTTNKFGGAAVSYMALNTAHKWDRIESSGGKFVENIVQATARDILTEAMNRVTNVGFHIVMHIHDEMVVDVPMGQSSVAEICGLMCRNPEWCPDLPLTADGFEAAFYQKD